MCYNHLILYVHLSYWGECYDLHMKCQQDYTLILKKKGLILLSDSLDCTISTILKFLFTLFFLHGINGDFIFTLPAPFCGSFVSLNVRDVVKEYRFPDNIKTFLVFQVLLLHVFGYSNANKQSWYSYSGRLWFHLMFCL